jgi:recombination protein RecA
MAGSNQDFKKLLDKMDKSKEFKSKTYLSTGAPKVEVISTGVPSLDHAIGGGIPRGCVIQLFGKESVGKTALTYYMIAEALKHPKSRGYAGFINLEGVYDKDWMQRITGGVDGDKIIVGTPDPGTQAVNMLSEWNQSGALDLIVFDSVGAMLGDSEQEADGNRMAFGQAGMITWMAKKALTDSAKSGTTVVFINQVRDRQVPGKMVVVEDTPGGHALKHASAMMIHLKNGPDKVDEMIEGEKVEIMRRVNAKVVKNKVAAAGKSAGYNFWKYPSDTGVIGIDTEQSLVDMALSTGIIERRGAWFYHSTFPGGQLNGATAVQEFLTLNSNAREQVKTDFLSKRTKEVSQERLDDIVESSLKELASVGS